MGSLLWTFDQLARLTRFEDAEVRYWAADRLIHLYPDRAPEVIGGLLFDDHDSTPALVASHLGTHGKDAHHPILIRGFKRGSGAMAGHCLEALARLGSPDAPALARDAVHRRDLGEDSLARIIDGLTVMYQSSQEPEGVKGEDAADAAREILMRRPELFADAAALGACFRIFGDDQVGDLVGRWITALHFRGIDCAEGGIRALQEHMELEDISWCLRTDRGGRVDLNRSLRAVENGYDMEIRSVLTETERSQLAAAFQGGELHSMLRALAGVVERRAGYKAERAQPGDPLPARIRSLAAGLSSPPVLDEAEHLGHALHTWLVALLLAALVKVCRYRNLALEAERTQGDYRRLLALAELESSALVKRLPSMLAGAAGTSRRDDLETWCLATLEARGPFFPKVVALETLGELRLGGHLPILLDYIADENGFVYGAAERALLKMGDDAVEGIRAEMERQRLHPDAMHSVLHVLADVMTPAALALALDYFDEFMEAAGPEDGAELMATLGARELIPCLRRHLKRSSGIPSRLGIQARVGHALLLLGAIHNVAIPEEEQIIQTIDEYWSESTENPSGGSGSGSPGGGPWVM